MINKGLLSEALEALSKDDVKDGSISGVKTPYSVSNQEALAKALANSEDKNRDLATKIIDASKKNEFSLKIGMVSEPNFDRFVILLKNTFSANDIFSGDPEIQKKLAELVSLAYFYAERNPDKRYRVFSNFDVAKQVATAIFTHLISSLKMTFLTYDTSFSSLLEKAILAVIYYPKPEKK